MANSNYREYLKSDEVRLKKYFYVLRPLLMAKWVLEKETRPPILFDELVRSQLDETIKPAVYALIEKKRAASELGTAKRIDSINAYIEETMEKLEEKAAGFHPKEQNHWEKLNDIFLRCIKFTS